jgi:hypothetical protein
VRVEITVVSVVITFVRVKNHTRVCGNHTLCVKPQSAGRNCTLCVEICLVRVEITLVRKVIADVYALTP